MASNTRIQNILAFALIFGVIVVARWLPLPANFTPVLAMAILCGLRFGAKPVSMVIPVLAMATSDLLLAGYDYRLMAVVYLSLVPMVWMGTKWKVQGSVLSRLMSGGAIGFAASLLFFFSTNFAVWKFTPWYEPTADGLLTCFAMALPFFHMTLLSTWLFMATGYLVVKAVPAFGQVEAHS